MITAILLIILCFWLTMIHWFWDVLFFSLALLLTIVGGPIVCLATLPVMAWCAIAFVAHRNNKKNNK